MWAVSHDGVPVRQYQYSGKGEQVLKYSESQSIATVHDEAGHWIGDYDATTGVPLQQVIWLDNLPVGLLVGSGPGQKLYYIEPDMLSTPRVVLDPAISQAVWRWDLTGEAFGDSAPNEDPDGNGMPFVFDMRFPEQRYDAASGFNYNYFRDCEPSVGRYSQSDPIGLAGGASTFGYVSGNPAVGADPKGLVKINLFPEDREPGSEWTSFELIPDNENECIIGGHGSPTRVANLTPNRLAQVIADNPDCAGKPITLYACNSGLKPTGTGRHAYAQYLANKSGQWVAAPDNWGWLFRPYYLDAEGKQIYREYAWFFIAPSRSGLGHDVPLDLVNRDGPNRDKPGNWVFFPPRR